MSKLTLATKRGDWMAQFDTLVCAARPALSGRIEWDTAQHLYNIGMTAPHAATIYLEARPPAIGVPDELATRMHHATVQAQEAFWSKIAEHFPEIKSGDLAPDVSYRFDTACCDAIAAWVKGNQS